MHYTNTETVLRDAALPAIILIEFFFCKKFIILNSLSILVHIVWNVKVSMLSWVFKHSLLHSNNNFVCRSMFFFLFSLSVFFFSFIEINFLNEIQFKLFFAFFTRLRKRYEKITYKLFIIRWIHLFCDQKSKYLVHRHSILGFFFFTSR